jgi:tRNA A37 threonylcarbamoyladenosine dehydratase
MEQFLRTKLLIGAENLKKLQNACVLVAGLGAVGGFAAEALARSGVGKFILIDFDTVQITNINRQIFALHSTLKRKKTEVAGLRILDINPKCKIITHDIFINADTLETAFAIKPDFVIDAIDSFSPKVRLMAYCYNNKIPLISSMGAALKTDPFSIEIADISKTHHCHLAHDIRRALKKENISSGVPCVFSTQAPQVSVTFPEHLENTTEFIDSPTRKILGSLTTITAMFGLHAADYAIKRLIR